LRCEQVFDDDGRHHIVQVPNPSQAHNAHKRADRRHDDRRHIAEPARHPQVQRFHHDTDKHREQNALGKMYASVFLVTLTYEH